MAEINLPDWLKTALYGQDQTFFGQRIGSWGLPEFGVTEASAAGLSGGATTDLSNAITGQYPQASATEADGGGGGGSAGGDETVNTTGGTGGQVPGGAASQDPNTAVWAEIDNIYNSMMGLAGQKESQLRANQPTIESDIQGQYNASLASGLAEKNAGERSIAQEETAAGQTKENALSAGKRLYNELSMAGQARFGGASSAGQAYSELTGREYQRGQADIYTKYQTAKSKITDLKANLTERWTAFTQNLDAQKKAAISEARRYFQDKLGEIDNLRTEAATNKSQMRLEVLQTLRNQIYEINLATTQTLATAQQQAQQAAQQLSALESSADNIVSSAQQSSGQLASTTTANPSTAYNIGGTTAAPTQSYTGIASTKKYDEFGNLIA